MKWLKRSLLVILLLVASAAAVGLHYVLPRQVVAEVTGVEVKRMDKDGVINAENPADGPTRDVYFINTRNPDTQKVRVYRNEDTGFGFPWYFKFSSADDQALAQSLSRNENQLALIRYYGWRASMLSMFPNLTSIKATDSRDLPFPWFNTLFFGVLALLSITLLWKLKRRLGKTATR